MMTEKDVIELITLMESQGFEILLDGGWGVDALLGRQTREHNDIDLFIEQQDGDRFVDMLVKNGYSEVKKEYTTEAHTVWQDAMHRVIDLHLFSYGENRSFLFEGENYAPDIFNAIGEIGGKKVRCITPAYQLLFHLGYEHTENDEHDVRMLCERFGLEPAQEKKQPNT